MENVVAYMPLILKGTMVTITVSLASVALAVIFGLIGAWGKLSKSRAAQRTAEAYTTLVRGIPDLVLMLLLFYGGQQLLNDLGESTGLWGYVEINQFSAGVGTIGFIFGAYMTETFRGAFLSIPRGQIEAGVSCGMSPALVFGRIIWPQLVRYALPSFGNNWLVLLKTTALVSVLGLHELVFLFRHLVDLSGADGDFGHRPALARSQILLCGSERLIDGGRISRFPGEFADL
jgi:His/Glu/Gln/Arg/opine family amino acid ABC transporter permease subunit